MRQREIKMGLEVLDYKMKRKSQDHLKKIINKQFKIAKINLDYQDILDEKIPNWYRENTCSQEQNKKWKNWVQKYLREKMKYTKSRAFIESEWINLKYGLPVKD